MQDNRLVMLCGGYFTRSQAARLKFRPSAAASDRQIRFLAWLGLVNRMRLSADPRCPQVYKLTARLRPNSGVCSAPTPRPSPPADRA